MPEGLERFLDEVLRSVRPHELLVAQPAKALENLSVAQGLETLRVNPARDRAKGRGRRHHNLQHEVAETL
ncbi:MAG: hypothetical protein ACYC91_20290 [Solirubrobacteraceae bacterium]